MTTSYTSECDALGFNVLHLYTYFYKTEKITISAPIRRKSVSASYQKNCSEVAQWCIGVQPLEHLQDRSEGAEDLPH